MLVKIQDQGLLSASKNTDSARAYLEYLSHENVERREKGLIEYPFFMPDGTPVSKGEIIDKLDRNHAHLSLMDTKFYSLIIAPDPVKEAPAMGRTEQEIFRNAVILARTISDAYAKGFHREGINGHEDLFIWWCIHFTRNGVPGVHLHGIVGRKARNGKKLSPLTNHRNTTKGPVQGGFDRVAFVAECEKIFDEIMNIDRSVVDTYEFKWAMKRGTAADKAVQAERLVREEMASLKADIKLAKDNRRKVTKTNDEVEEILALLGKKDFKLQAPKQTITDVVDRAAIGTDLMRTLATSDNETMMRLNLASLGLTAKPRFDENEGAKDLELTYKGQCIMASEVLDTPQLNILLDQWARLTGQESAFRIRQRREREEDKKKLKLTQEYENQQTRSFGIRRH
jgi:hypothetical protein